MKNITSMGGRIADARKRLGHNQSELSRLVGVTAQCVQQWERDETTPRGKNLTKLSEILQVSEQYILFGTADNGEIVTGSIEEYKEAFYMSKEFERDYHASIESLISAGEKMGWFGKGAQLKGKVRSLVDFGLLALRSKEKS